MKGKKKKTASSQSLLLHSPNETCQGLANNENTHTDSVLTTGEAAT